MAKAKKSKPRDDLSRWTVRLIKATPARLFGAVYASSEAEAIERAIEELLLRTPCEIGSV
jgi:hypothetical protein